MNQNRFMAAVMAVGVMSSVLAQGSESVAPGREPGFKKVMIVIFENANYEEAMAQPFFQRFAKGGALLANFHAETHPSQPNYVALISGDTHGVVDDDPTDVDGRHLGDLLEQQGKSWKVYAENYPGGCFTGSRSGTYVRKHVPFISFRNVQSSPERCARIVEAKSLQADLENGTLPDFSLYVPDLNNDGHDTGAAYADRWFGRAFGPLLQDRRLMKDMLLIATFDESEVLEPTNHIYTAVYGDSVVPGTVSRARYDHYSLLRTIEESLGLASLGNHDAQATSISDVWR